RTEAKQKTASSVNRYSGQESRNGKGERTSRPPFHSPMRALASAQNNGRPTMSGRNGLISTAELADILGQADLRLFDCTTYLEPAPEGSNVPYLAVPGRHTFEAGHIPGADFLDLQGEFSDSNTPLRFVMPDVAQLERA